MAKLSALASDLEKEVKGIRVHYEMGIYVIVARSGNPKYREKLAELLDPHREAISDGSAPPDLYDNLLKQARSECILLGWENIDDDEGNPIPYSAANALAIFMDPRYKDFYRFVIQVADNGLNYRAKLIKEMEGNSPSTSDGSKSGVQGSGS